MGQIVPETSVIFNQLTWLIAQLNFTSPYSFLQIYVTDSLQRTASQRDALSPVLVSFTLESAMVKGQSGLLGTEDAYLLGQNLYYRESIED
jgi:hypothetical protein